MVSVILLRVLVGVAVGAVASAGIAYGIYKLINRDNIKDEIKANLDEDKFKDAFKAVVKERVDNGQTIKLDVFDELDARLEEVSLTGDEISNELSEGEIIYLKDMA